MTRIDEVRTTISVKDVMSSPVVTVEENDSVEKAAKLMDERDLGSIIVTDLGGNPVGIITERDIVARVAARNLLPGRVEVKTIMSAPLHTVAPEVDIKKAAETMHKHKIRRLIVMEKGRMIGVITSKDILAITPALIEIILEKARITAVPALPVGTEFAGNCDRCGQWSDILREIDGRYLCDECQIELHTE